ncbi:MAG: hypothetical protein QM784_32845 [Polyangiaceae bacterium]
MGSLLEAERSASSQSPQVLRLSYDAYPDRLWTPMVRQIRLYVVLNSALRRFEPLACCSQ